MRKGEKFEITQDVYQRATANRGYIVPDDMKKLFTEAQRCGYGVYSAMAHKEGDKYYCSYWLGDNCD